jgi:dUTP pyrophosphatase
MKYTLSSSSIGFKKLHPDAIIPKKGTPLASGFDLCALDVIFPEDVGKPYYLTEIDEYVIFPGERVLVRTGIAVQLFQGVEGQIRPRSGLSLKKGIYVAFGTIDADYTGDLGVILTNNGDKDFVIHRGDRIAQLVFAPVLYGFEPIEIEELENTERASGGFGSTGVKHNG